MSHKSQLNFQVKNMKKNKPGRSADDDYDF